MQVLKEIADKLIQLEYEVSTCLQGGRHIRKIELAARGDNCYDKYSVSYINSPDINTSLFSLGRVEGVVLLIDNAERLLAESERENMLNRSSVGRVLSSAIKSCVPSEDINKVRYQIMQWGKHGYSFFVTSRNEEKKIEFEQQEMPYNKITGFTLYPRIHNVTTVSEVEPLRSHKLTHRELQVLRTEFGTLEQWLNKLFEQGHLEPQGLASQGN
jgi:hypothetical protein